MMIADNHMHIYIFSYAFDINSYSQPYSLASIDVFDPLYERRGPILDWAPPPMQWKDMSGGDYDDDPPNRDLPRPDVSWTHGGPVLSARALRAVAPLIKGHAQPLPLDFETGEEFYVLHVMTFVDGLLDREASGAENFPSNPTKLMSVKQHVLWPRPGGEPWPPIFRLGEDPRAPRFVNSAFRQAMLDAKVTGAEFTPIKVHPHPKPA